MKDIDQAAQLRRLVLRSVRESSPAGVPPPRLIVVSGGQSGVGTTTLAVNLAVTMADQGTRSVLVDADLYHGDVADLCGLSSQFGVIDVLAARRDIHEVLLRGPLGLQVVPGSRSIDNPGEFSESAQRRLVRQLRALGCHAEVVVVDCGSGGSQVAQRFWSSADVVLLVVTTDASSVMDTYANIKRVTSELGDLGIQLLVNRVSDSQTGVDVHRRIDLSCKRFLGFGVAYLGSVPDDSHVPAAATANAPFVLRSPDCAASKALEPLARQLIHRDSMTVREPASIAQAIAPEAEKFVTSSPAVADFGR